MEKEALVAYMAVVGIWIVLGFIIENICMSFYLKRYPEGGSLWPLTLACFRIVLLLFIIRSFGIKLGFDILAILAAGEFISNTLKITRLNSISNAITYYCVFRAIGSFITIVALFAFAFMK